MKRRAYLSYCRNLGYAKGEMKEHWPKLNDEERTRVLEMSRRFLANMQKEIGNAEARRKGEFGAERRG